MYKATREVQGGREEGTGANGDRRCWSERLRGGPYTSVGDFIDRSDTPIGFVPTSRSAKRLAGSP